MALRTWQRNGWSNRHIAAAAVMTLVGLFATRGAWLEIYTKAMEDPEMSHILLVPFIVAWLIYIRRGRWRQCQPNGQVVGPILVAIGWYLSWYGYNDPSSIDLFYHGGSLMIVVGCLLSVLGRDVLFRFLPAFAVLLFLLPVPARISEPLAANLQTAAAFSTEQVLVMLDIPVERHNSLLTINGVEALVAEACNGMRGVFTLILVSYAFAFGTPLKNWVRATILIASPITALVCNIIRLIPTIWLFGQSEDLWVVRALQWLHDGLVFCTGYLKDFGLQYHGHGSLPAAMFFHDISGWIMIFVAFLLLLGIIRVLRWALVPVTQYTLAYD